MLLPSLSFPLGRGGASSLGTSCAWGWAPGGSEGCSPVVFPEADDSEFQALLDIWFPEEKPLPTAFLVDTSEEALLLPDWLKLRMIRSEVLRLVDAGTAQAGLEWWGLLTRGSRAPRLLLCSEVLRLMDAGTAQGGLGRGLVTRGSWASRLLLRSEVLGLVDAGMAQGGLGRGLLTLGVPGPSSAPHGPGWSPAVAEEKTGRVASGDPADLMSWPQQAVLDPGRRPRAACAGPV